MNLEEIVSSLEVKVDGEGPDTIVMVHGFPDSLDLWDPLVEILKKQYRCVRYTLPGFEKQPRENFKGYDVAEMRQILDAFIESLKTDKVTVLAHDWGAVYAAQYLTGSNLVSKLILLDVGEFGKEGMPSINLKYMAAFGLSWLLPESWAQKLVDYTAKNILKISDVDPHLDPNSLRWEQRLVFPYYRLWKNILSGRLPKPASFSEYNMPTLFIYGKDKKGISFHGKSWAEKLNARKDCRVVAMNGGHWMMLSHPEELAEAVMDWLRK